MTWLARRRRSVVKYRANRVDKGVRRAMCRNIKTLFNFDPPATEDEIRGASVQFVRKLSGFNSPSKANEAAFNEAIEQVTAAAQQLLSSLVTNAEHRNREVERERARIQSIKRFGVNTRVTANSSDRK
jgi:hypothetical protein